MFITFEGIDVSGKTTQAKLLSEYLREKGFDVVFLREPGGTPISEKIRGILLDAINSEMVDRTEFLLYSASRSQLVHQVILPMLKENKIVICDRFYDSSTAYQGYGRGINQDAIKFINNFAAGIKPDVTFFIDIDLDELKIRFSSKKPDKDRLENSGEDFFNRVRNGYYTIAEKEPDRYVIINGKLPKENISEIVREIVMTQIKGKIK